MTTTLSVTIGLSAVLVPIGFAGAVLAAVCALVAGVAIMRGAAGLCGGAVALWIPCAIASSAASFANQWMPLQASAAALIGMLVIGAVVRAIANTTQVPAEARIATPAAARTVSRVVTPAIDRAVSAPVTGTLALPKPAHAA